MACIMMLNGEERDIIICKHPPEYGILVRRNVTAVVEIGIDEAYHAGASSIELHRDNATERYTRRAPQMLKSWSLHFFRSHVLDFISVWSRIAFQCETRSSPIRWFSLRLRILLLNPMLLLIMPIAIFVHLFIKFERKQPISEFQNCC